MYSLFRINCLTCIAILGRDIMTRPIRMMYGWYMDSV